MKFKASLFYVLPAAGALAVVLFFQNCSPVSFTAELPSTDIVAPQNCDLDPQSPACVGVQCQFNGQYYNENDTVTAYQSSAVPAGQTCQSEVRRCEGGVFTGSYTFASCGVGVMQSCLFNGKTIPHGEPVRAFQTSTVPYGSVCQEQYRVCTNGTLSGSYMFGSCTANTPSSCLFNGQTIAHGQPVTAFAASSVPYGQTCTSQVRTCNNGALSGSYNFASCNVGGVASCNFNGQTIAHGQPVTAFATSSVPYGQTCTPQVRTCNNGVLSGSYTNSSCVVNPSAAASCSVSLSPGNTLRDDQVLTLNVSSDNASQVQVNCGSGYQNLNNMNGANSFGPFPAGSYTCQFRALNSVGTISSCNPASTQITVTTAFSCPSSAPLYAGSTSLGKNVSVTKNGNSCLCENSSVLSYNASLNRCMTACPSGSILTNSSGVYQCSTCKPATVSGRNGTYSVDGVVIENTCAYSGVLTSYSTNGGCYLANAMIGWPSGLPTTLSSYPSSNPDYGTCRFVRNTQETAFLMCERTDPNITNSCGGTGGGGGGGGSVGGGGFNNSGVPGN